METRVTEQHKRTWDMIVKYGVDNDIQMLYEVTDNIQQKHPSIAILDIAPHYSLQTFNQCMESSVPLLSLECWKDVHPGLVTIPLAESYTLPYGVVAAREPTETAAGFLAQLRKLLGQD